MNRRTLLSASSAVFVASTSQVLAAGKLRVAVIGHTGRGNYGHGLDTVWTKVNGVEIVGVADADERGLEKAIARLKPGGAFKDYREMLKETRPEFVSVAPRHVDQRLEMILAAIDAGARGLYVEKPFCRTPAEADQILSAAKKKGVKIAVAHRNRYHPALGVIDTAIKEGKLGRLLELRGHGLGDRRGGGEDLWVLGSHVLNLLHYFGGEPLSCSATILKGGKPVTGKDVKAGAEGLGPIAGDEIHASWLLSSGLRASYTTHTNDGSNKAGYAAHLIGTKGSISIHIDRDPVAWFYPGNPFNPASRKESRIPITSAGIGQKENRPDLIAKVHNHVLAVEDLIKAVDEDRQPLCDAKAGAVTVEMICGVFESHRRDGARVPFPLEERGNALTKLK